MKSPARALLIMLLVLCLVFPMAGAVYAAAPQSISVYLKPDLTIKDGEQTKSFYDEKGQPVFPLVYNGTTYLPVRAIAALMGENIEWDGKSRTIFIGRTLSSPGSDNAPPSTDCARDGELPSGSKPSVQIVSALLMTDIIIMYDFEIKVFMDAIGRNVYPINYQGSNYLPIRAVSGLMGEDISWDPGLKLITISSAKADDSKVNENAVVLKGFLTDVVNLFDDTTAKIVNLQNPLTGDELALMETDASNNVMQINRLADNLKNLETSGFSDEDIDAYDKLLDYADSVGYYIQVAENIIYMASQEQDYSMFAETFLTFAMDAQSKYEAARDALKSL